MFGYISYIKTLFAMALFVHNENQRMLWETLNKLPLFHEVFSQNSMSTLRFQDPQIWFKNIIQLFYDNNRFRPLSSADLKELNREVMKYAIENLKSSYNRQATSVAQMETGIQQQQSQYYVESKQENYNRQFTDLQQVYERMGAKPEPPKAEFAEGLKDDAISNMDELLRKHMEEREQELPKFAPLPTMQALQTLPKAQSSNSLKITEEKITIRVDEVVHDDKKKVSWSQDIKVEENIEKQEARVLELENQIQMLQNEFDAFKRIMMERVQTIERQFNATTQNKMFE